MRLIELKAELQSCGAMAGGLPSREGGAGPSDGTTLFIGDVVVNVPVLGAFATRSRFSIEESGGQFMLFDRGVELTLVEPACGAALSCGYDRAQPLQGVGSVAFIVCGGAGVLAGRHHPFHLAKERGEQTGKHS